jgi:hypothetical protein
MGNMMIIERTALHAEEMAYNTIEVIKTLHNLNMDRLNKLRVQCEALGDRKGLAHVSMLILQLSFNLSRLAVHTAHLQEAAENQEYAKKLWSSTAIN